MDISNLISDIARWHLLHRLKNQIKNGGFKTSPQFIQHFFDAMNVVIIRKTTTENDNKLKTESGIIISNHPGYFDAHIITMITDRSDYKILVSEEAYKRYVPYIGEDNLLQIKQDVSVSQRKDLFEKISRHISCGGVILIFPMGAAETLDPRFKKSRSEFGGFSFLLQKILDSEDMVYCFYIDPDDILSIIKEKMRRGWGVFLEMTLGHRLNFNRLKQVKIIHVYEHYSKAEEWQKLDILGPKKLKRAALMNHFKSLHLLAP